jgi:hypothetical protein
MPLDNKLNIVNHTNESIQVLITESPGWQLIGRVEAAAEALLAAQTLMAAIIAAPALGIGALALDASAWTAAKLFTTFNSARRVVKIAKKIDKFASLVQAAESVIDDIPKVSQAINPGQTSNLMDKSGWGELFSPVGWGDLFGANTIVVTLYSNTTGKALHFYSKVNDTWTINDDGASNTEGASFTWDGYASSTWNPASVVDADGNVVAFWIGRDMALNAQYVSPQNTVTQPDFSYLAAGPMALGLGAAYHEDRLFLGYGSSVGNQRYLGLYKTGSLQTGWGGENGYLLYDPYRVPTSGDDIGATGVALASYAPSGSLPLQMVACFHLVNRDTPYASSLTLIPYAQDNGDSPRSFGNSSPPTVYLPNGLEMHSYSCPSVLYAPDGTLIIAVDVGPQSDNTYVEVYSIGQYSQASALLARVGPAGRPGLGTFGGKVYVALSMSPPNAGIYVIEVSLENPTVHVVTSGLTNGSVTFSSVTAASVETAYLTWRSTDGGLYYAFSTDLNIWNGPYPLNDLINPGYPDGG